MLHDATKHTPIPYPIPAADAATLRPPLSTHSSTSFAPFDCRHHSHQDRPWDKAGTPGVALRGGCADASYGTPIPTAARRNVTTPVVSVGISVALPQELLRVPVVSVLMPNVAPRSPRAFVRPPVCDARYPESGRRGQSVASALPHHRAP